MSKERNIKWLNDRRMIYRRFPINDIPDMETDKYMFFKCGTYENYSLFNTKAKITTYKSLKWHMLVLYYLNPDPNEELYTVFRFISDKENGFVTFFISEKVLNSMISDVFNQGGDPPANKIRKVIFKEYNMLTINEKLSIVGKLIGRNSCVSAGDIYETMLDLNDFGKKITISRIAGLLDCSTRTIYRKLNKELKQEIKTLNEEI
tara:strand:+ start:1893 stop:2507 length:615 start_codon:yes stop_codon:yes gene_type:complete